MKKRKLSFWEIWNMSFGFLGIQFGFALQNANTSRIFETLGAEVDELAVFWLAAPVTGLLVQPIIGYFSDRTWHPRWGRRRPYFLVGAILASISLCIMPNSPSLWVAIGTLWIMDSSINISMEPFRAFVGDNLPEEQRTVGFAMQSFFIGLGAVVGSAMPYIFTNVFNISNTAADGVIPDSVKWSFYIGAIVFLAAVLWTVFRSKEYPPEELAAFEDHSHEDTADISADENTERLGKLKQAGIFMTVFGAIMNAAFIYLKLEKELYILSGGILLVGILFLMAYMIRKSTINGFVNIMTDLLYMPKTMKQLTWVQFFSWFALFSMWIYTTQAVTSYVYGSTDPTSQAYNDGADWVTVLFAVYNGVAALVAFLLPVLAKRTSRKTTHFICLVLGGLGLMSISVFKDPNLLIISMIGVGVAWASILSIPYAMLAGALPPQKMGYYMGVFNFFIVIPQIVAASVLGFLLRTFFENQTVYALIIGGVCMILSGLLTLRVSDTATIEIND
ncbi:MFS transporter [Leptobacterium flavescens]|uniref:MFS transporter n=1 Tax=Leptobacterium flavescens TaxID=472055 RepID=A0A6P0UMR5_9FLAO|nr:MFS transporter [Leptobacterium flavescens]NER14651.1 MFS transporter [Leptobacterium flavescens]